MNSHEFEACVSSIVRSRSGMQGSSFFEMSVSSVFSILPTCWDLWPINSSSPGTSSPAQLGSDAFFRQSFQHEPISPVSSDLIGFPRTIQTQFSFKLYSYIMYNYFIHTYTNFQFWGWQRFFFVLLKTMLANIWKEELCQSWQIK